MTIKEKTKEQIKVMQACIDGATIECVNLDDVYARWIELESFPVWNWDKYSYRVKLKQLPKSIPATEEELAKINRKTVWIKNKKNPECIAHVLANYKKIDENWLVFNPDTKCWEDREEDADKEERLRHHYNGGQP